MAAKRRSLGKGLDALLSSGARLPEASAAQTDSDEKGLLRDLHLDLVQRGQYQPRREFNAEALEELADSIKAQGVMQPIVVRPISGDRFEIIAGERRWRAAQQAGLERIPALVRDVPDSAAIAMALIENIQREDLNPVEEAVALDRLQTEFEMTQQQVADAVGKSRSAVANLLRLNSLAPEVKQLMETRALEMGHARCLVTLEADQQRQIARQIVAKALSVRQTEALVRNLQKPQVAQADAVDPDIRRLETELTDKLGAAVSIQHGGNGKGKLVVKYTSLDELDGILSHLR
ncbi:MAG: ParB/RepB/Spo0J family partition protein [Pseudomonadota bacterium]